LGTFWLKIEQFWPFEDIPIFSNGVFKWPTLLYFKPESAQI
jgi:hypothetical protein